MTWRRVTATPEALSARGEHCDSATELNALRSCANGMARPMPEGRARSKSRFAFWADVAARIENGTAMTRRTLGLLLRRATIRM